MARKWHEYSHTDRQHRNFYEGQRQDWVEQKQTAYQRKATQHKPPQEHKHVQ